MKIKKVVALILTAGMVISMAACGQKEQGQESGTEVAVKETAAEEPAADEAEKEAADEGAEAITFPLEEPVTVSVVGLYHGDDNHLTTNSQFIKYQEMTNVMYDLTEILSSEAEEKINLMFASGEYPDVFYRAALNTNTYGVEEGILIPLEDLIREYAPNLTAILDEKELWDDISSSDGHIYALPAFGSPSTTQWHFRYNKVWLDNLGLEAPTNTDELYEALKAIKEQDANGNGDPNDEIPMTFASNGFEMKSMFGYLYPDGVADTSTNLAYEGEEFKEVSYLPATEKYKELLGLCAKWYAEGLIDEKSFTQPIDDLYTIPSVEDQYGFFVGNRLGGELREAQYHVVPMFEGVGGISITNGVAFTSTFSITDKCECPEVMVAWADYFYSQEGAILAHYGVEGTDWQYDANGLIETLDGQKTLEAGTHVPIYKPLEIEMLLAENNDPEAFETWISLEESEKVAAYGVTRPAISVSEENADRYNDLNTSLSEYINNYLALVVVGDKDLDATWDEYLAELEKIGLDEYMEIVVASMPEGYVLAQ